LVLDAIRAEIAIANHAFGIGAVAFLRLPAPGDRKSRHRAGGRTHETERVKRRLGRWIDLGADIAARDRIGLAVIDAPFRQRLYIMLVEFEKALIGEGSR